MKREEIDWRLPHHGAIRERCKPGKRVARLWKVEWFCTAFLYWHHCHMIPLLVDTRMQYAFMYDGKTAVNVTWRSGIVTNFDLTVAKHLVAQDTSKQCQEIHVRLAGPEFPWNDSVGLCIGGESFRYVNDWLQQGHRCC